MGSCLSTSKFSGEGRTLADPPSSTIINQGGGGQRLGSATSSSAAAATPSHNSIPALSSGGATAGSSAADREARALAAERRINAQANKGAPSHGKLSQQLNSQKTSNPLSAKDDEPQRVVWD